MAVIFGGFSRTKTKFFDKTKPARDWISTKTCKAAGYAVVYGVPALQLAGEVVGDVVEAAGIPEDPIQYNPIKTATPWFLKMFAGMSPDYHLARGNKYLDDALDLLVNYEEFIPPNLMTDLVKNWLT
ncbi:hypothetical protein DICSQDRAFT_173775 [Dichomitus squalens LYAD-421 SS1]|uniref:Uncharacterized protein n=1 Tax=Dichomitus squalens (strain LYAD-421) TaxID=732165 RepID=R7SPP1_DICSQ|nr:uncharacterized protein DICSQDRAFT_173775 [Dichomitus squalens LYAD-421 SS1]EJF57675.1 hypothetical protein DICSQDRAFT_173775 [Dichomitus squalens LYAD-421 SS1]